VPGTDQCSLTLDRGKPAEEELPEAPGALEETEGGLREDLPPGVQGVAACRQNDPVGADCACLPYDFSYTQAT